MQKSGFFQKYKPTKDAVETTKALFKKIAAARNNNPIADLEAEGMVNDYYKNKSERWILSKDTPPTFTVLQNCL